MAKGTRSRPSRRNSAARRRATPGHCSLNTSSTTMMPPSASAASATARSCAVISAVWPPSTLTNRSGPPARRDQVGGREVERVALMQHQPRDCRHGAPGCGGTCARSPLPDRSTLRCWSPNRSIATAFSRLTAQQIEQDEELAVMDADLGDAALDAERPLAFAQRDDGTRRLGAQPAVDIELAAAGCSCSIRKSMRRQLAHARRSRSTQRR